MIKIKTRKGAIIGTVEGSAEDIISEFGDGLNRFLRKLPYESEAETLAVICMVAVGVNRDREFDWDKFSKELEKMRRRAEVSGNG